MTPDTPRPELAESGLTEAEGLAASLRQQADWIEESRECLVPLHDRIDLGDIDVDELRAAADFIERKPRLAQTQSPSIRKSETKDGFNVIINEKYAAYFPKESESQVDLLIAALSPGNSQTRGLHEIPDDDADFTPDLARKVIAKYQELLTNPVAVHLNMLRGGIAKPSWENIKHLYPEEFAALAPGNGAVGCPRCAELEAEVEALKHDVERHIEIASQEMSGNAGAVEVDYQKGWHVGHAEGFELGLNSRETGNGAPSDAQSDNDIADDNPISNGAVEAEPVAWRRFIYGQWALSAEKIYSDDEPLYAAPTPAALDLRGPIPKSALAATPEEIAASKTLVGALTPVTVEAPSEERIADIIGWYLAAIVSGNSQPHMSGDLRNSNLQPERREGSRSGIRQSREVG